ncbi:MAG: hypothetical protein A2010_17830 [Nitrospirae bacterium GWD2_57_9]|nr:MAG: hypothetical protein A2010_17830 [Nitrospirae bacterium GWD2_57_9]OGW46956.1 MAG: hypothetical protein A2078_08290 [Nitrospirae bacterium GWC2_57_9]
MKKVCFVLNNFVGTNFYGGGGRVSYEIIRKLADSGYRVDILCSSTTHAAYPGINRITVIDKPFGKKPRELEAFFAEVDARVEGAGYDAVIADNMTPYADVSFVQYHTMLHRLKLRGILWPLGAFSKIERIRKHRKWARTARRFIAVSQAIKRDLMENLGVPGEKIGVVYPGVKITEIAGHDPGAGRSPGQPFTFGCVATGFPTKGGYIFFKALNWLMGQGHRFRARIVCPGYEKKPWTRMLVRYYGLGACMEFLPYQKNIREYYASLDCLVMPSIHEAFGLVALEAMANKLPCIVSSVSGASEIIQDGVNGFVFAMKGKAHRNLAEKMSWVLENSRTLETIGNKGYKTALHYNWDRTCRNFVKELNLGNHRVLETVSSKDFEKPFTRKGTEPAGSSGADPLILKRTEK